MAQNGGAIVIHNPQALVDTVNKLTDNLLYKKMATTAKDYVVAKSGATAKVMDVLTHYL